MEIKEIKIEKGRKGGWFAGHHNGKPVFIDREFEKYIDIEKSLTINAEIVEKGNVYIAFPFEYSLHEGQMGEVFFIKKYLNGKEIKSLVETEPSKIFIEYFHHNDYPRGGVNLSFRFTHPIEGNDCYSVVEICSANKTLYNKIEIVKKYRDWSGAEEILAWYDDYIKKVNFIKENKKLFDRIERSEFILEKINPSKFDSIYNQDNTESISFGSFFGVEYHKKEERDVCNTESSTLFGENISIREYWTKENKWWKVDPSELSNGFREQINTPETQRKIRVTKRYMFIEKHVSKIKNELGDVYKLWKKMKEKNPQELKKMLPPELWV